VGGAEGDLGGIGVQRNKGDILGPDIILPGGFYLALGRQVAIPLVIDDHQAATVDDHIEHAIGATEGVAQFGMALQGDGDAGQGLAVAGLYATANHSGATGLDGTGGDIALDGVGTRVQEFGGIQQ